MYQLRLLTGEAGIYLAATFCHGLRNVLRYGELWTYVRDMRNNAYRAEMMRLVLGVKLTREMNRLRMERRASLSSAKREVERIGIRIKKPLNLLLDDEIAVDEGKAEIKALDARRRELQAQLETADDRRRFSIPRYPRCTARRSRRCAGAGASGDPPGSH
jgi:hypothetical protein